MIEVVYAKNSKKERAAKIWMEMTATADDANVATTKGRGLKRPGEWELQRPMNSGRDV